MSFDPHKNFAYSTVATAPSPATSGTTLVLAAGDGTLFPNPGTDGDFNVTVWPAGTIPTEANAEICRVTARSTDTLTITRAQEGSSARAISVGDQIALTITAKVITDIESAIGGSMPSPAGKPDGDVLQVLSGAAVWGADPGGGGAGTGEETLHTVASSGAALTVDIANGATQDITLTANCTISLTSPASGDAWGLTLLLRQDATGSRKVTWPGSVTWMGGVAPTLQAGASAFDFITLITVDGGTTWYGAQAVSPAPSFAFAEVLSLGGESTSSTTYADLATVGPSATITVGASGIAVVGWNCQPTGGTPSGQYMSVALSGGNTVAANDNWALNGTGIIGRTYVFTGLTPGSTTFRAKYRVGTGTQSWIRRSLWAQAI